MVVGKGGFVPLAVACAGLCLSIYVENRSFVLGCVAAILFLWFVYRWKRLSAIYACIIGLSFVLLSGILALAVKRGSTEGRVLIYKVSADIFRDHYLWGLGPGNFKKHYLHYQSAYFERGNYSERELLLADNTYYAFNDYWQFVLEWGVFGGVALLLVLLFIGYMIYRVLSSPDRTDITFLTGCVLLITIAVAACFNHVFERVYVQLGCFFGLAAVVWAFAKRHIKNRVLYFACILLGTAIILIAEFGHKIVAGGAYHRWREGS